MTSTRQRYLIHEFLLVFRRKRYSFIPTIIIQVEFFCFVAENFCQRLCKSGQKPCLEARPDELHPGRLTNIFNEAFEQIAQ
jgi:hypothetical protein